jgi:hypothetical protein
MAQARETVYRRAVDALRTATEPMTAREVAGSWGLSGRQYKVARQASAGGPDRDHQFVVKESSGQGCPAGQ